MFNIASLSTKEQTVVHLRHPVTDELLYADEAKKKPIQVTVYGSGSSVYRNALTAMQNRQLKRNKKQMSAELIREESTELLVQTSVSADNFDYNGNPLTTKQAWTDLYNDVSLAWVREQVETVQGDISAFLES